MFYAATLVGWIRGDFVYRKVTAKNIFLITAALQPINFVTLTRVTNNASCNWVNLVQVRSVQFSSPTFGVNTSTGIPVRHGTGSLGHRVSGSFGSSFTYGSPCHHFDPVWDPSFSGFRKSAQNAKRTFEMLKWQKSLSGVCCWTEITWWQSMQSTVTFIYEY